MITYTRMTQVREQVGAPRAEQADPLDPAVIGARVKALREAEGLSLRDLAERSGVSAPMLSQVERGETSPTLTVAARIASGLELRLSQLLRLTSRAPSRSCAPAIAAVAATRAAATASRCSPPRSPGQRAELSRHTLSAGGSTGAVDEARRSTSRAAARPRSSRRAASCWSATAPPRARTRATP